MQLKDSIDNINKRCEVLKALGFECWHRDSNVHHPAVPGMRFDFSATAEEHFVTVALKTVWKEGQRTGANGIRAQFADMMTLEPGSD